MSVLRGIKAGYQKGKDYTTGIERWERRPSYESVPNVGYQRAYIEIKTGKLAPEITAFGRLIEIKDPEPEKSAITGVVSSVSSLLSKKGKDKVETVGARAGVMSKKTLGGILDSLRQAMRVTS